MRKLVALSVLLAMATLIPVSTSGASSQTPQLHFNGHSPALRNVLLTAGDIEGVPGAPSNVEVSKVNDASGLYQDPDPRLACGRKAPDNANMNTAKAVDEQFSMPEVLGLEAAANLTPATVKSIFNLYEGDIRIGCTYQSRTNTGTTQTTTLVKRIPMPQLVSHVLGLVEVVRSAGQTFGSYEMVMIDGSRVASLALIAEAPVRTTFVVALARVAEERLLGHLAT